MAPPVPSKMLSFSGSGSGRGCAMSSIENVRYSDLAERAVTTWELERYLELV